MEPKFQTSFIPKKPVVNESGMSVNVVRDTNAISIVAGIVLTATVLVSGGLFAYKSILLKQIDQVETDINSARDAFGVDKIKDLIDANTRIVSTKNLLENHVNVSKLLSLIQDLTVKKVRLLNLTYSNQTGSPIINLSVEAQTYNALAEQSRIFAQNEYLSNNQFTKFSLAENGYIRAEFTSVVDTTLTSYKKAIESQEPPVTNSQ